MAVSSKHCRQRGYQDVPALIRTSISANPTGGNTLRSPRLANVEGKRLAVLRNVGANAVLAHAAVGQRVGVALVFLRGEGGYAGLLGADERALCPLVGAPCVCRVVSWNDSWIVYAMGARRTSVAGGDAVGVDAVGVVLLGDGLAGGEAGEGRHAKSQSGTHCGWDC
jgi:hypothetical protein